MNIERKKLSKKVLLSLSKDMYNQLCQEKQKTGASMSEIIRRAISRYLEGVINGNGKC